MFTVHSAQDRWSQSSASAAASSGQDYALDLKTLNLKQSQTLNPSKRKVRTWSSDELRSGLGFRVTEECDGSGSSQTSKNRKTGKHVIGPSPLTCYNRKTHVISRGGGVETIGLKKTRMVSVVKGRITPEILVRWNIVVHTAQPDFGLN